MHESDMWAEVCAAVIILMAVCAGCYGYLQAARKN